MITKNDVKVAETIVNTTNYVRFCGIFLFSSSFCTKSCFLCFIYMFLTVLYGNEKKRL